MELKKKVIRVSAVALSLKILLKGQLRFLNEKFDVIGLASPDGILDSLPASEGIKVIGIKIVRKISIISDILSLFKLILCFLKEKPTIVHSITPKAGLLTMVAGYISRVPIRIHTFTGLIFPTEKGFKKLLLMNMDRVTCFCATDIVPEGEGVKRDLIKNKITLKEISVLGNGNVNGIDTNFYSREAVNKSLIIELRNKLLIDDDDIVFSYVGRIVRDKGVHELIEAFTKLNKRYLKSKLIIVGSFEDDYDPIDKYVRDLILNHQNIKFLGFQDDVRPYLALSQIFVFPSYREGFPNVVMQAGAMGLPSIVTNINGSNEIIIDGVNGFIVNVKNTLELENAMHYMVKNPLERKLMALNAEKLIESRYKHEIVWDELLNLYIRRIEKL